VSAPAPELAALAAALAESRFAGLEVGAPLGAGSRCTVYAARFGGIDRALKLYKPRAAIKHVRHDARPLAQYEFESNKEYCECAALAEFVAEPIDYLVTPTVQFFLQERLTGPLYYFWYQRATQAERVRMRAHIDRMVEEAHRARIYGINLQALNVIVVPGRPGRGHSATLRLQPPAAACAPLQSIDGPCGAPGTRHTRAARSHDARALSRFSGARAQDPKIRD
jgi:hypothetical protein